MSFSDFLKRTKEFVTQEASSLLFTSGGLGACAFIYEMTAALSDGILTDDEIHRILQMSSGGQSLILIVMAFFLKKK